MMCTRPPKRSSVSEAPWNSLEPLSLWDIMDIFKSKTLAGLLCDLQRCHDLCDENRRRGGDLDEYPKPMDPRDLKDITEHLQGAETFCEEVGWENANSVVSLINIHLKEHGNSADYSSLCADLRNALDAVMSDTWKHKFVQIDPKFANHVNNDGLFGESVGKAFPSAVPDIKEAGNCLAIGLGTATVFHLMRAAEWGLRALAAHLGMRSVRTRDRKGKNRYKALAYSEWEHILNQVRDRVDKRIMRMRPGQRKQSDQEFYYPVLQDIRAMRDAWRNHVMHARTEYGTVDAEAIKGHVESLLVKLASRVSEV